MKEVFKKIGERRGDIKGAEMLFLYDIFKDEFKRTIEALITCLDIMNFGYVKAVQNEESQGTLYGRKNCVCYNEQYIPLPFVNCKYVIISGDMKIKSSFEKVSETEAKTIIKMLKNGDINGIERAINKEAYSYLKSCFECELSIPVKEYNGFLFVVKEDEVDKFVKNAAENLEEKTGNFVQAYICDTANSGVECS